MKFNEKWLREWVNPEITTDELVKQLTMAGLEVDSVKPATEYFSHVVIGQVFSVTKHPNADRLQVCQVDVGEDKMLNIVCGARNVREYLKVAVARVGACLVGDLKIKKSKIRDVESEGMICSSSELGLAEKSEGIIELPDDAPVGENFYSYLDLEDKTIELGLTPNRADCLSIRGLAREVAALNRCYVENLAEETSIPVIDDTIPVKVSAIADCPRYVGRIIKGVNARATTPFWMQEKLRRCGLRSISPVVDVTNYIMLEIGQPLHAYDLARIKNKLEVRKAKSGESVALLNGQTVELDEECLVIADSQQVLALAGIMGGQDSAVTANTQDIFLEGAYFDPIRIAGRARRLGVPTDTSHRFERGVDPYLQIQANERATQLLIEIVGGTAGPIIHKSTKPEFIPAFKTIKLLRANIKRMLGIEIPDQEVRDILQRLGLQIVQEVDGWQATVPTYRFDLAIEVDLIEELARIYGYDRIPKQNLIADLVQPSKTEHHTTRSILLNGLVNRGYHEVITYSFINEDLQKIFNANSDYMKLINPISNDMSVMRTTLWPGLLQCLRYNINRQQTRAKFFEIGQCFRKTEDAIHQDTMIAGLLYGERYPLQWGVKNDKVDFYDLKNDIEALLTTVFSYKPNQLSQTEIIKVEHPSLHPGQSAMIKHQDHIVGYIGALHPQLAQQLEFDEPVYLFEFNLTYLHHPKAVKFKELSKFPMIRRDLAIVLPETVQIEDICTEIWHKIKHVLQEIIIFDIYRGKGIENGYKSVALGLLLQHPTKTLIDDEVEQIFQEVLDLILGTFKAQLRS